MGKNFDFDKFKDITDFLKENAIDTKDNKHGNRKHKFKKNYDGNNVLPDNKKIKKYTNKVKRTWKDSEGKLKSKVYNYERDYYVDDGLQKYIKCKKENLIEHDEMLKDLRHFINEYLTNKVFADSNLEKMLNNASFVGKLDHDDIKFIVKIKDLRKRYAKEVFKPEIERFNELVDIYINDYKDKKKVYVDLVKKWDHTLIIM